MSKIKIFIEKGVISLGKDKLKSTIKTLDGEYLVSFYKLSPKTEEEWRKYYFLLRDILYEDGETGYTKIDIHNMAKNILLLKLKEETVLNFKKKEELLTISTASLSMQGWQRFVELFKEWAFESFNCYL